MLRFAEIVATPESRRAEVHGRTAPDASPSAKGMTPNYRAAQEPCLGFPMSYARIPRARAFRTRLVQFGDSRANGGAKPLAFRPPGCTGTRHWAIESVMNISVVTLTVDRWGLLETLFRTSRGVGRCWCMWPLCPPKTHRPDAAANRKALRAIVESGNPPGLIAITEKSAVGWCAVGPRARYPQYAACAESSRAWAIPCVYIGPGADREPVAAALIEAAVDLARENGAVAVHGPPPWWLPGDDEAIASATATFVANGFERIGPGARIPELRRTL